MVDGATISIPTDYITLSLLLVALFIFSWLAMKSRSIKTFQFQISVFIGLMVLGALVELGSEDGMIKIPQYLEGLGFLIHVGSMIFFSLMMWIRYHVSKKKGRTLIEEFE